MSETLVKFDEPIIGLGRARYIAQAVGRERDDGLWEGWLEFIPVDDNAPPIPSGRETTQPKRTDLEYWAQGLTRVYLQGALSRAEATSRFSTSEAEERTREPEERTRE